jgi:hypothetical protein
MKLAHLAPRRRRAAACTLAAVAAAVLAVAAPAANAAVRTNGHCSTRQMALTGWSIYRVCLTAVDTYTGSWVSGYVSGVSCQVYLPTGAGWSCRSYAKGSYWDGARGYWEDWLNFALVYTGPSGTAFQNCVYLRIDTTPNGVTTYQDFTNQLLPVGTRC